MNSSGTIHRLYEKTTPTSAAKKALNMLYEWQKNNSDEPITVENFYPVNLEQLALLLDYSIERVETVGYVEGQRTVEAQIKTDEKIIIISTKNIPEGAINYSLAHEIGHIFLGHGLESQNWLRVRPTRRKAKLYSGYSKSHEIDADKFARELLMPQKAVRYYFFQTFNCNEIFVNSFSFNPIYKKIKKYQVRQKMNKELVSEILAKHSFNKAKSLVDLFSVSVKAMIRRLIELRLVLD